jgi:biopolymer transport protein ExbD
MAASMFSDTPSAAPRPQAMAGINITPLVDVMLVLLVIFMVTMPIRSQALDLQLPGAAPSTPMPEPVHVAVQADGSVLLDGARVEVSELVEALRAQRRQAPAASVVLDSSSDADYGVFAFALAAARNAGYQQVAIRR